MKQMNRNLILLYIIKISQWFMLYMPVVKLFYEENNLDNFDLLLLHSIYSGIIFLAEVPSGYLSDVWGRKKTILTGLFLGTIGFVLYSIGTGFWPFLIAEIALGIGAGFTSGTDSALLYDTLAVSKRQQKYIWFEGFVSGTGNLAEALAGIMVTIIALNPVRGYYYLQTLITVCGFIAAFFLIEPKVHAFHASLNWRGIADIVKDTLWHNKILQRYIILSAIIGFSSISMAWLAQIYLFDTGLPAKYFGITWAALNGIAAIGSMISHKADLLLGKNLALVYILFFLSAGFFVAAGFIAPAGIIFLLIFYFVRGTAHPILKERIQHQTPSQIRATVLSVRSLLIRILFAILGPFLGAISEKLSLSAALITSGLVVLVPGTLIVFRIIRKKSA